MAQLVVSAAGAAIGFFIGGPTGAQVGWAIGSVVGASMGPTQKFAGPRLSDLKITGTEYGQPIPYVQGHPGIAGQIWWASDRREIATTTSEGGKGGPSTEQTTYTYEVDLLIGLSDNVIVDVPRVWSNGKLIFNKLKSVTYDTSSGPTTALTSAATLAASATTEVWRRVTVYTGSASQLPDPTYEAAVGTGNAPAYRGRGSIFIEGFQLGTSGQIPNLTFEVTTGGTYSGGDVILLLNGNGTNGSQVYTDSSGYARTVTGGATTNSLTTTLPKFGTASISSGDGAAPGTLTTSNGSGDFDVSAGDFCFEAWVNYTNVNIPGQLRYIFNTGQVQVWIDSTVMLFYTAGVTQLAPNFTHGFIANTWHHVAATREGSTYRIFVNGVLMTSGTGATLAAASANATFGVSTTVAKFDDFRVTKGRARYTAGFTPPTAELTDDSLQPITLANETLQNVVSRLCIRAGLTAGQFDVTALSTITKPVRALAVSQTGSTRAVLDMLASAYYFEAVLSDKLYFRPRGGASAVTIPYADLGASQDPAGDPEPLALRPQNDLEIPAQVAVSYMNVDADYQRDTQMSDRLISSSKTTASIELALGFTASEAKGIADAIVMDQIASAMTTKLALLVSYARLEPTDVVTATAADGSTFRLRLVKKNDASGVLAFDAVLDDASVLTSAGITSTTYIPGTTVAGAAATVMELMDIPILRDADSDAGIYVAAKGDLTTWPGAAIYRSRDGLDYSRIKDVTEAAVLGTCTTTLGNWTGGNVFDEVNTVTVSVGNGTLASSTHDLVLDTGVNACLIGSEILHFRVATLSSAGIYVLSGLLRGRRGTEAYMTGHAASEAFVMLQTTGLRRLSLETSEIGAAMYYKGVTIGRSLGTATAEQLTGAAVGLKPFSPVDVRATRSVATSDITLTWSRRTRLATAFTNGSVPLGETTEAYEVDIYTTSGFVTVKRTLTGLTSATATYTSAQQVTDFGSNQATIYVRVYQISEVVGRGFAGQGAV